MLLCISFDMYLDFFLRILHKCLVSIQCIKLEMDVKLLAYFAYKANHKKQQHNSQSCPLKSITYTSNNLPCVHFDVFLFYLFLLELYAENCMLVSRQRST